MLFNVVVMEHKNVAHNTKTKLKALKTHTHIRTHIRTKDANKLLAKCNLGLCLVSVF
jgi:hypothetical protein